MYSLSGLRNYVVLVCLLLLMGLQQAHSQAPPLSVINGEYFFDTDPGKGNGTAFTGLSGDVLTSLIKNGINSLSPGNHTVNVRVMGIDNNWSNTFTTVIYTDTPITYTSLSVVQGEYFFDTDPGKGNGTPFLSLTGDVTSSLVKNGINNLSPGSHTINVRVMGLDNNWSQTFTTIIYTDTPVTYFSFSVLQGEYFFDTDPGIGNGTAFIGLSGDVVTGLVKNSISSLSPGSHTMSVRVKGLDNNWSQVFSTVIYTDTLIQYVPLSLVQGEYFFDTDPGQGNATAIVALDGHFDDAVERIGANPSTNSLDTGLHRLSVRVKGIDTKWSPVFSVVFYISPCSPIPTASVSPSASQTICSGDSVIFTASATGTGIKYQWRDNGANITGATALSYHAKSAGIYDVAVTNSAGCGVGSNTDSVILSSTAVVPAVTITVNPGNPACAGTNVTFTAQPVNGGATPSYQWYLNGGKVGSNSGVYSNSVLSTNDKIYCVLTSTASCVTTRTATSAIITMTITPIVTPAVNVSATPGTSICPGTSVTFNASPTNGGTNPSYQWKVNGNNAGSNSSAFGPAPVNNNDVVTCILTSNASCTSTATVTSSPVTITVNPTVTPQVTISSNVGNTVCPGNGALFTAIPVNGGASPSYQWKVNGNNVGTNSITYTDNSIANGDVITCVLTSNAPCVTSLTDTSNSVIMTVSSTVTPSVTITALPGDTTCAGSIITFTAAATGGGNAPTYQWKINGGNAGTNSSTFSTTLNNNDNVSCVLTSNSSCATTNTAGSNSINITVNPQPVQPVISQTNDTLISTSAVGYQWYFAGNIIAGATQQNYITTQNGQYQVEITDANGCKSKSNNFSVINTAVNSVEEGIKINIYPNPNSGNFIIEGDFENSTLVNISLVNTLGENVMVIENKNINGKYSRQVDIANFAAGVYFLKIENDNSIFCRRVVKM